VRLFGGVYTRHIEHVAARAGPLDAREISASDYTDGTTFEIESLPFFSALVDFLTGDVSDSRDH